MTSERFFLNKSLQFISETWDEKDGKYTQLKIAQKLDCTTAYLSKAKTNENYARLLKPKLIAIIEKFGGQYIEAENLFIDKEGKRFEIVSAADRIDFGLHRMDRKWVRKILARKTKELCILTTWVGETADDVMQLFNNKPELLRKIDTLKILILNPNAQATYLRGKSMGINSGRGFNKIKEDLQSIFEHHQRLNEILPKTVKRPEIQIRLYDELPSVQLIMSDTKVLVGFYLQGVSSKSVDNLVLERDNSQFIRQLDNHFFSIWNNSEPLKIEDVQAKIEELTDPPYKRFNIHRYKDFENKSYFLYYAERYSPNEYRTHKTSATIGCNILQIEENVEGVFKCRMKAAGVDDSEQEYYGELTNTHFNNPDYLLLTLTNKTKTRHLSLYFSIKNKEKNNYIFGLFSVIYKSSGHCGSGFAVLKEANKTYKNLNPTSLSPNDLPNADHKLPYPLISYLIDKKGSLLRPVNSIKQIQSSEETLEKVAGTYYVYAYSGSVEEPQITQGVATLYTTGMVDYKNRINGFDGVGYLEVDKAKNRLYIEVINSSPKIPRKALFIIDCDSLEDKRDFFTGVCTSITWHEGTPVASRIIAQKINKREVKGFDDVEPKKITLDSEEYVKLPLIVKQNLTGIFPNMVGFFEDRSKNKKKKKNRKEKNREIELSETFYKAACYDVSQKDTKSFLINLKHAVTHGFNDLEKLKAFKTQMPDHITEINRIKRIMDKMQKRTRGN